MARNVYADEAEFTVGVKKLKAYADALIAAGKQYNSILQTITANDIQDVQISMKLNSLAVTVQQCTDAAEDLGKGIEGTVGKYMDELEALDKFVFPDELLHSISAILASFL